MSALRIGTRGSALALWQAGRVAELISAQPGAPAVELVHIKTEGDIRTDVPLWSVGGRAFFTKEIDRALLESEIDIAVHSLKDLSTTLDPGIELAAILEREDPRDALLISANCLAGSCRTLTDLPRGARIGTSSLRRRAFLSHARPDVKMLELRGNVPTRIEKLHRGEYDAIVLAAAGLKRLGLEREIACLLPVEEFPPAVSQGAIGVCMRAGCTRTMPWLRALDDERARLATTAERALLRKIEGGCQVPLGALARVVEGSLNLFAAVCALDGSVVLTGEGGTPHPGPLPQGERGEERAVQLGEQVAEELLAKGAGRIIAQQRHALRPEPP